MVCFVATITCYHNLLRISHRLSAVSHRWWIDAPCESTMKQNPPFSTCLFGWTRMVLSLSDSIHSVLHWLNEHLFNLFFWCFSYFGCVCIVPGNCIILFFVYGINNSALCMNFELSLFGCIFGIVLF